MRLLGDLHVPEPRVLLDDVLELTVVGSFSRLGPAVRGRMFGWTRPGPGALAGRSIVVTGATSGIGRAAAGQLADLGARVVLVGRREERLARVRAELSARHGDDAVATVVADLGSLASVHGAVRRILDTEPRLDGVVDNAGAIFAERRESPDGIEATLAVMVVGPFALVAGLLSRLRESPRGFVISVTSGGMYTQSLPLDDLQYRMGEYSGPRAYARAKRAQVAMMREWARRLAPAGVAFSAMHPGWADTPGLSGQLPGFRRVMGPLLRTPDEGADTITWLATRRVPMAHSGGLYLDRRRRPFDRLPGTRVQATDRERLWDDVVRLAGIEDPAPLGPPSSG